MAVTLRGTLLITLGVDDWLLERPLTFDSSAKDLPPRKQLLRTQVVPARPFRDHHPRRQALGHDPRLCFGAPPTPPQCPGDHLEPPNLTNLWVNPTVKR
jgi:hypothetical protein